MKLERQRTMKVSKKLLEEMGFRNEPGVFCNENIYYNVGLNLTLTIYKTDSMEQLINRIYHAGFKEAQKQIKFALGIDENT